jgi:uncharacterized membrane protein YvlD (DUF360 family)
MKKLIRMFVFSAVGLYATSLLIKSGFVVTQDPKNFAIATLIMVAAYYLIAPLMKIIFLPFNIVTFGMFSFVVYILLLNFLINYFGYMSIHPWTFPGLTVMGFTLAKTSLNYWMTLALSALSFSTIINLLESLL